MRKSAGVLLALIMAVQSGCATMLKGSNEQVMITSDPAGANVSINGQNQGTTPYVANVPSSQDLNIQLSKPGYQATSIKDGTSFRWGYEIWSFLEFVIPLGVDMADGAAWGHDQTMVAAHMDPVVPPVAASQPATIAPASGAAAVTSVATPPVAPADATVRSTPPH